MGKAGENNSALSRRLAYCPPEKAGSGVSYALN